MLGSPDNINFTLYDVLGIEPPFKVPSIACVGGLSGRGAVQWQFSDFSGVVCPYILGGKGEVKYMYTQALAIGGLMWYGLLSLVATSGNSTIRFIGDPKYGSIESNWMQYGYISNAGFVIANSREPGSPQIYDYNNGRLSPFPNGMTMASRNIANAQLTSTNYPYFDDCNPASPTFGKAMLNMSKIGTTYWNSALATFGDTRRHMMCMVAGEVINFGIGGDEFLTSSYFDPFLRKAFAPLPLPFFMSYNPRLLDSRAGMFEHGMGFVGETPFGLVGNTSTGFYDMYAATGIQYDSLMTAKHIRNMTRGIKP
jgi:hypothetical protein